MIGSGRVAWDLLPSFLELPSVTHYYLFYDFPLNMGQIYMI